ncbi:metal ABC transporter permease [Natronolimnohabitans innermongolicus]|uniref:ABC-3 protein n=1 Tax=Natronolimnohabitans innermongolicus JCM 12255 TaxID=1227499 RepID=L9XJN1_9EURY|nr:metal ABC transporter permease [Natronolimnohabitans innermongolicus]ELY61930.1 ABC-3 protein [Natronolimnohabitans innermongolicus JCM 12255]
MNATARRSVEFAGIVATALLAVLMIGVISLEALRDHVGAAAFLYEQFIVVGEWMDYYLGTGVFSHGFMWRTIGTVILIGIIAPVVGTYLVHREMALIGETLAHTAFAGVAVGLFFSATTGWDGNLLTAALVVAILGALGVQWLAERTDTYGDVPIAIMLTGSFAVGTIIIEYGQGLSGVAIEDFLFGSAAVVPSSGAQLVVVQTFAVLGVIAITYKQLLFITFDEQAARVARLNVTWYNALLIVMTAVVVVGAMQILGVILVAAMLVVPVAAASQLAESFRETLVLSVLFGQASVLAGYAISIHQGIAASGPIVVVAIAIYLLTIAASSRSSALSMH